jgi:two-component system, cell cycle response regulator DivK
MSQTGVAPLILIVEDDEKSRRLMVDVLSHQGYRVAEANNAEDGIDIVRKSHPDLVLMDIHLPGMSGMDALKLIRADEEIKSTRIMAITASVMGNDRDKIKSIGFDAFEPKPINLKAFLSSVKLLVQPIGDTSVQPR